ncbi:MAG TPA: tetratricopeptide repeat protein, partial [Acidobacteriota bacterium]|nr:tetratricopeptide repeat protein [Acidobacteriota bacterium]
AKALQLQPELAETRASRGLALSLSEQFEEAEEEFEKAIRLNPRLFEAFYFYARTCFAQGKLERAAELFARAARVNPEDVQSPSLLGCTYAGLGWTEKAEAAYRLAVSRARKRLELNPDDARTLYLGAQSLLSLGETDQAVQWAEKSRALVPDDPYTLYGLACFHAQLGNVDEAIDYLQEAVKNGFGHVRWIENDVDLKPLRNSPRYRTLLSSLA